jgi:hypothetical protein
MLHEPFVDHAQIGCEGEQLHHQAKVMQSGPLFVKKFLFICYDYISVLETHR